LEGTRDRHIVVVGGGITGVFASYFLARAGAHVTLVERDEIGAHASGANPGGLNPLHGPGIPGPMQELALESLALHRRHAAEIRRLSGIAFGERVGARVHLALSGTEADELASSEDLYNSTPPFSARFLTAAELRAREPRIAPDASGGLWVEGNTTVDALSYTRAVGAAAERLGVQVVRGEARGLHTRNGRATAIVVDEDVLDCDGVVLAGGPWCEAVSQWLDLALPVEPVKGELLLVELEGPPLPGDVTRGSAGAYLAAGGGCWLGGTEDRAGYDETATTDGRERILAAVSELLPMLEPVRVIRHVAGLRPVTPGGFPVVGVAPGYENVCVSTGAGRKGMLLGAACGSAVAGLLLQGRTPLPIGACSLTRSALGA
jgi:glycine oxidase